MELLKDQETREMPEQARLALRALRRAVRDAFLSGEAFDPDGSGRAYWESHDEFGNPIPPVPANSSR